jgi:hypothetical protein
MDEKIEGLEKRVKHLEERVSMLAEIADSKGHPFLFSVLESNLTEEQVHRIYDLMGKVETSLKSKTPMNHNQFENELYRIVPSMNRNFTFAKSIVMTLHDEHQFEAVYQHLKKDGMNI